MPKIETPTELAAAVTKLDTQDQQLAEFDDTKEKLVKASTDLEESSKQVTALEHENKSLKQKLADAEAATEAAKTEPVKAEPVAEKTETKVEDKTEVKTEATPADITVEATPAILVDGVDVLASLQNQIEELKGRLDASTELAAKATDAADEAELETKEVKEQVALVAEHLMPKGAVPDIEETGTAGKSESYKTWLKLSNSNKPEDRRAARKLKAADKEITAEIDKGAGIVVSPAAAASSVTAEQTAIFEKWKGLLTLAKENESPLVGKAPVERHRIHAQATTDARRLYKQHKADIDACAAAAQA